MAPNQIRSLFDTLMSSDNGPKPLVRASPVGSASFFLTARAQPLPMTPTEAISRSPSPPMPSRDHRLDDPVPALLPSGARFAKFGFALNKQWYQLREEDNTLTKAQTRRRRRGYGAHSPIRSNRVCCWLLSCLLCWIRRIALRP